VFRHRTRIGTRIRISVSSSEIGSDLEILLPEVTGNPPDPAISCRISLTWALFMGIFCGPKLLVNLKRFRMPCRIIKDLILTYET
jgi:hypothetical protein